MKRPPRYHRRRRAGRPTEALGSFKTKDKSFETRDASQEPTEAHKEPIGFIAHALKNFKEQPGYAESETGDDRPVQKAIMSRIDREGEVSDDLIRDVMEQSELVRDILDLLQEETAMELASNIEGEEGLSIVELLDHYSEEMIKSLLYIRALRKKMLRLHDLVEKDIIRKESRLNTNSNR